MEVYKIRRISDGLYYRGKSKFTKFGTYFRMAQIIGNISWVKTLETDVELVSYDVKETDSIILDWELNDENLIEILNRDEQLKKLLK